MTTYHGYLIRFGLWIYDPETMRYYAYDLRVPPQFHGVITGQDAAEFRDEINAAIEIAMGRA
jgi:hypothetical protein